ncbi:ShlB/FhaC/HecB family hemolysin secretion/activation protein [Marinobacter fonticola]|uniref:ShlB/FhaC/HecB family hemolysin secretion/activation protein n=1 Tax=Marinobacter fonticola TaxID=2603215 RepID=UPI0011E6A643|nr:ShlB/FhaC/HecB family hemolysin secretion/activation protein [Marinobacter fonticola]
MLNNVIFCICLCLVAGVPFARAHESAAIGAVVFEGVSAFDVGQLLPTYLDHLGQNIGPDGYDQLRERVSDYYVRQGYLRPVIRAQRHEDTAQVVRLAVDEPYIGRIEVEGGSLEIQREVRDRLSPLMERPAVSKANIDAIVRDIEGRLSIGLSSAVEPSQSDSAAHTLRAKIGPRIGGRLTYSAEGSQRLGQHLIGGTVSVYGLSQDISELYVSALHTADSDGYRSVGAGMRLPTSEVASIYLDFSNAKSVPQDYGDVEAPVYRRNWGRFLWWQTLVDERTRDLSLYGSAIVRDYTRRHEGETEIDESLRMALLGVQTYLRGRGQTSRIEIETRFGVDAFGAKRTGTDAGSDIDLSYQVLLAEYTYWRGLPADFSLRGDIAVQYSPYELPYSQRFSIGGTRFARAYEPGEFSGDSGAGGKLELRRAYAADGILQGSRLVPYIYYGLAAARQNANDETESAAASGIGLRFLGRQFAAYAEYGKPLTVESEYRDNDARLTGRLSVTF